MCWHARQVLMTSHQLSTVSSKRNLLLGSDEKSLKTDIRMSSKSSYHLTSRTKMVGCWQFLSEHLEGIVWQDKTVPFVFMSTACKHHWEETEIIAINLRLTQETITRRLDERAGEFSFLGTRKPRIHVTESPRKYFLLSRQIIVALRDQNVNFLRTTSSCYSKSLLKHGI